MTSQVTDDRLKALAELNSLVLGQKVNPNMGAAIAAILSIANKDPDEQVSGKTEEMLKQVLKSNDALAQSIVKAAYKDAGLKKILENEVTPQFYIHLATSDQEGRANKIKAALEKERYRVLEFQVGEGQAPATNQLRYYSQSETGGANHDNILALLKKADENPGAHPRAAWSSKLLSSDQVSPGTFEIWLAGQFARSGTLVINLTDADGNKIEDVAFEVFIASLSNPEQESTRSTSGYEYHLLPGKYNLTVKASGYQRKNQTLWIHEGKDTVITLSLRPKN